ncbi:MAG: hypothetical protein WC858_03100 [Parcubacteria group bacterium]
MENANLLAKCPNCNRKHQNSKTKVLSQSEGRTTLYITCKYCQVSTLILVSESALGLVSIGMMIDLGENEVRDFIKKNAITDDEIIEVHRAMKKELSKGKEKSGG